MNNQEFEAKCLRATTHAAAVILHSEVTAERVRTNFALAEARVAENNARAEAIKGAASVRSLHSRDAAQYQKAIDDAVEIRKAAEIAAIEAVQDLRTVTVKMNTLERAERIDREFAEDGKNFDLRLGSGYSDYLGITTRVGKGAHIDGTREGARSVIFEIPSYEAGEQYEIYTVAELDVLIAKLTELREAMWEASSK